LTSQRPASDDGAKFKEQAITPAALKDLKDSQLLGISKGAPDKDKEHEAATSGALAGSTAGGGSANTQTILPRHRGAVERYFERKK
jgi:hypothetical protein